MSADLPYLSAREAADYCGVSEKTIRNWLASGRLEAEKSAGSFRISSEQLELLRRKSAPPPASADRQSADVPVSAADFLRMIDERDRTIMELAGRVGYYQAEVEQLRTTLKALQAPKEELEISDDASPITPAALENLPASQVSTRPRRPWYQRLLFG